MMLFKNVLKESISLSVLIKYVHRFVLSFCLPRHFTDQRVNSVTDPEPHAPVVFTDPTNHFNFHSFLRINTGRAVICSYKPSKRINLKIWLDLLTSLNTITTVSGSKWMPAGQDN